MIHIGTLVPQWAGKSNKFWLGHHSGRTKTFVLSAQSVVKRMQNIRTDSSRVAVMSDDFAQSNSDLACMFVSIPVRTGPESLP